MNDCAQIFCEYITEVPREGCSILKSPETRQVQERLVSTLEQMQVPNWDRTRCPQEFASSVGMPHPLQLFYGNLTKLGKKSNSVIRSRSVKGKICVMSHQWRVSLYMLSSRMSCNIRERVSSYCLILMTERVQIQIAGTTQAAMLNTEVTAQNNEREQVRYLENMRKKRINMKTSPKSTITKRITRWTMGYPDHALC